MNIQRGVIQNEKRQSENWPYAIAQELTAKGTYPSNHPYSWTVAGSMKDLDDASLPEWRTGLKLIMGQNNAAIVIAGDVKSDEVFEKVKKYFGIYLQVRQLLNTVHGLQSCLKTAAR